MSYHSTNGKRNMDERRKKPKKKSIKRFGFKTTQFFIDKGMIVCSECGKLLSIDNKKCNSCGFDNVLIIEK